jgi:hypothetical protein
MANEHKKWVEAQGYRFTGERRQLKAGEYYYRPPDETVKEPKIIGPVGEPKQDEAPQIIVRPVGEYSPEAEAEPKAKPASKPKPPEPEPEAEAPVSVKALQEQLRRAEQAQGKTSAAAWALRDEISRAKKAKAAAK